MKNEKLKIVFLRDSFLRPVGSFLKERHSERSEESVRERFLILNF
jgi:hypothetical protein